MAKVPEHLGTKHSSVCAASCLCGTTGFSASAGSQHVPGIGWDFLGDGGEFSFWTLFAANGLERSQLMVRAVRQNFCQVSRGDGDH